MKFVGLLSVLVASVAACALADVDTARQALRDSAWDVARRQVQDANDDVSRQVVLKSFAAEHNWLAILEKLEEWGNPVGEAYLYYRALCYYQTGKIDSAERVLSEATFTDEQFVRLAALLRADIAIDNKDAAKALKELLSLSPDNEVKMRLAEAREMINEHDKAVELWKSVVSDTNAAERLTVVAAANLGDLEKLQYLENNGTKDSVRTLASLRLAMLRLSNADAFESAVGVIRTIVHDNPDADSALVAMRTMANAYLNRKDPKNALQACADIIEMWPKSAHDSSLQEMRATAFCELGNNQDAITAFEEAEKYANNSETLAKIGVKIGDQLMQIGREADAVAKYEEVIKKCPDTEAAKKSAEVLELRNLEGRARESFRKYNFKEAMSLFEELSKRSSTLQPRMQFCIALCLFGLGRDAEAEKLASSLLTCEDVRVRSNALLWLAKLNYNHANWREATKLFVEAAKDIKEIKDRAQVLLWGARAAFFALDYTQSMALVTSMINDNADAETSFQGLMLQGKSLMELARFGEAVLIADRALSIDGVTEGEKIEARLMRADALFAMGADNGARYNEALEAYEAIRKSLNDDKSKELVISYRIGKTLEKLQKLDFAIDEYYARVLLAYRDGRKSGARFSEDARSAVSRAAFRLADEYESRGNYQAAVNVLRLMVDSGVSSSNEALIRINRLSKKGD